MFSIVVRILKTPILDALYEMFVVKPYLTHVVLSIGSSQEDALYLVKPHLIARLVGCDQELTRLQGHLTRGRGLNKWIGEYVVSG